MNDFLINIIVMTEGVILGYFLGELMAYRRISKLLKELEELIINGHNEAI